MTTTAGSPRQGALSNLGAALQTTARAAPTLTSVYVVVILVGGVTPVATAWLVSLLFDRLAEPASRTPDALLPAVAGIAVLGVLVGVLPTIRTLIFGILSRAVGLATLERLYIAVSRAIGIARMESPQFRDQVRMAQQSGHSGPTQLVDDVLAIVQSALTLCGFLATLLLLSPLMAAVLLGTAAPAVLAQLRMSRARVRMMRRNAPRQRREHHYADLLMSLPAAKELRLLGLGDLFRGRMLKEMSAVNIADDRQSLGEARTQGTLLGIAAVIAGGGLAWSVHAATRGHLSIGDVSMFIAAVGGTQASVHSIVERIGSAHRAGLLFHHFRQVEAGGPDLVAARSPRSVPALKVGIELRDVWFRYQPDKPWVLSGVTMFIPYGKAVALVGLNGAGKSTLIKLLCRFYDPTVGEIRWDGLDLRELDPEQLRQRIGAVFQDYMHYELSVAENIGVGDVAMLNDRPAIVAAAERAGVHRTVGALPHGYDTLLSTIFFNEADMEDPETGVLLSGGQLQRVALARAFMRDRRDLMILDEPSAGLDAEAEHEIHEQLRSHRRDATSVLISHRLGAVRDADRIVVLSGGRVAEVGSHDELIADGGTYARLFELQAQGYQARPA